jgi:RNA polymerase sigma-32 factor
MGNYLYHSQHPDYSAFRALRAAAHSEEFITHEQSVALVRRWRESQDYEARNTIIVAHRPLFAKLVVQSFGVSGTGPMDMLVEAELEAIEKFDNFNPALGSFSSYIAPHIKGRLAAHALESMGPVKLGAGKKNRYLFTHWNSLLHQVEHDHPDATPYRRTAIAIDRANKERAKKGDDLPDITMGDVHLYESVSAGYGSAKLYRGDTEEDALPGDDLYDPAQLMEAAGDVREVRRSVRLVRKAVKTLDPRQRRVVEARLLCPEDSKLTLETLAAELGLTRERVRQIEGEACKKIRQYLAMYGVTRAPSLRPEIRAFA